MDPILLGVAARDRKVSTAVNLSGSGFTNTILSGSEQGKTIMIISLRLHLKSSCDFNTAYVTDTQPNSFKSRHKLPNCQFRRQGGLCFTSGLLK